MHSRSRSGRRSRRGASRTAIGNHTYLTRRLRPDWTFVNAPHNFRGCSGLTSRPPVATWCWSPLCDARREIRRAGQGGPTASSATKTRPLNAKSAPAVTASTTASHTSNCFTERTYRAGRRWLRLAHHGGGWGTPRLTTGRDASPGRCDQRPQPGRARLDLTDFREPGVLSLRSERT